MAEPEQNTAHERHLERSERVWNRWAAHYSLSESDFEPMREAAMDRLGLEAGDAVLDVGCGPGVNFQYLRNAVRATGHILAVDYSPEMVERARERVAEHGWENVDVRKADATRADLGDGFDAAVSTLAMSVMPDIAGAVRNVYGSLVPGGRFVVFDLRPVPTGPLRVVNPVLRRALAWMANWNPDGDVLDSLGSTFDAVAVVDTYAAGTAYTAVAERAVE